MSQSILLHEYEIVLLSSQKYNLLMNRKHEEMWSEFSERDRIDPEENQVVSFSHGSDELSGFIIRNCLTT
jgi:hypothetical protein